MFQGSRSVVGLDIGSTVIKAVEVSRVGKEYKITGFGQVEVPPDDNEARVEGVANLMAECGFRTKNVVTSVSGKNVIIRYLSMVPMSDEELRNAILFEAEKYIPFTLDDCVLDCQRLDGDEEGAAPKSANANVMLVACKNETLQEHMETVHRAGLTSEIVDVDAFALGNAYTLMRECGFEDGESEEGTVAFVDVGASKTSVNIVKKGVALFTREIYFGGKDFTEAISRRLNLDFDEAEDLKRCPGEDIDVVKDAVFPTIDDLGNELQLSFEYFESQHGSGVDKIMLSGGGSRFGFFRESFEKIFEKPTFVLNPFEAIGVSNDMDEEMLAMAGPQMAVAIGLASRIRK